MDKAQAIANQITTFKGVTTEIADDGGLVYIYGNTYSIKDQLKSDFGAKWAPDLRAWYVDLRDDEFIKNKKETQQARHAKDFTDTDKHDIVEEVNEKVYSMRKRSMTANEPLKHDLKKSIKSYPEITFVEMIDKLEQMTIDRETAIPANTETRQAHRKLLTLTITIVEDYSTKFKTSCVAYIDNPDEYQFASTHKLRKGATYYAIVEEGLDWNGTPKIMEIVSKSSSKAQKIVDRWKSEGYTNEYKAIPDMIATPLACLNTIKH